MFRLFILVLAGVALLSSCGGREVEPPTTETPELCYTYNDKEKRLTIHPDGPTVPYTHTPPTCIKYIREQVEKTVCECVP